MRAESPGGAFLGWLRRRRFGLARRTMLLLVSSVSGSLIVLAVGFTLQRQDDLAELVDASARGVAAQVHSTRLVLLSVPAAYRRRVSEGLLASGTVYAFPTSEVAPPDHSASPSTSNGRGGGFFRDMFGGAATLPLDVSGAVRRYAQQPAEVRYSLEGAPSYWVRQDIDGESWWIVVLAGRPPPAASGVPWIAVVAVLLGLLAIAALYAATITRPLRNLADAIQRIGDGWPEPLNVHGPAELREVVGGFNAMLLRLRQIEDERQVLLGGLPHDLRAPLTRLRLRLATLTELGEHPGIVDDIGAIDRIVRQFIEYLRGVQSDEPLVPLGQVLHAVVDGHRSLGRDVHVEGDARLPELIPQYSLQRLLDNLVENSVQHGRPPISVRVARAGPGFVDVVVTDHGDGISPEMMDMALEPFTKGDPARGLGGCGLGLAIVRQLARQLGGGVRFERGLQAFSVVARLGVK
jgi:signal transduction histidine kinase